MYQTESSRIEIILDSEDMWQDLGRFTPQSRFMTNTPRDPAGSPEPQATASGAAAQGVRNARATGPLNAIDRFKRRSTGARAADSRSGIEDHCVGGHAPVRSRANDGTDGGHHR